MTISKHPLDFAELSKGDTLGIRELEDALSMRCDQSDSWKLKKLGLSAQIERETGFIARSRMNPDRIEILSDSDASEYTTGQWKRGLRTQVKQIDRRTRINTDRFSNQQRDGFNLASEAMARITAASFEEWRQIQRRIAARRTTAIGSGAN